MTEKILKRTINLHFEFVPVWAVHISHYSEERYRAIMAFLFYIISGLPREPLLEMLGEFYLSYILKRGHDEMLRNLGSNILEFLQNVDSVHACAKKEYPDMIAPSFRCEADSVSDRMTLHYYSYKEGLFSVAKGILMIISPW